MKTNICFYVKYINIIHFLESVYNKLTEYTQNGMQRCFAKIASGLIKNAHHKRTRRGLIVYKYFLNSLPRVFFVYAMNNIQYNGAGHCVTHSIAGWMQIPMDIRLYLHLHFSFNHIATHILWGASGDFFFVNNVKQTHLRCM